MPHVPLHPRLLRSSRRRRWLGPLVIVLVAGAIAWWAAQRETSHMREVEQMVLRLCRDSGAGRDVADSMTTESKVVAAQLAKRIREICPTLDDAMAVEVRVVSGDPSNAGSNHFIGTATHTAIIHIGDVDLLGLRINHQGDPGKIVILGYFETASP